MISINGGYYSSVIIDVQQSFFISDITVENDPELPSLVLSKKR